MRITDTNEERDWRIYFAQSLIRIARDLYLDEPMAVQIAETVYAPDSTTIDLHRSLFPWAAFRQIQAAVKLHTLLDLRGSIPAFIPVNGIHDLRYSRFGAL